MLKLLKGLDRPPTIINTDHIKFAQLKQIGYCIRLFMNEGFAESHVSYEAGIVLDVDYKDKYNSEAEAMEDFLEFLNGSQYSTDDFGICSAELNKFKLG